MPGESGAMPTCRWASCPSISRSSGFSPSTKAGSFSLAWRSASLIFRSECKRCRMAWRRAGRHLLPARKQRLADVSLLLGSHLLPNALPVAQSLLLARGQAVPGLKTLADLGLLLRRQAQKALVIPQKLLLACRRHILKPFDRFGRQIVGIPPAEARHSAAWALAVLLPRRPVRGFAAPSCWVAALNFCPDAEPHRSPAASQAAKTVPNWNRSFITWLLSSLPALTQPAEQEVRKARQISRSHRNSQAPANPGSSRNPIPL